MIDSFVMDPNTGAAPTNPLVSPTALFGEGQGGQGGAPAPTGKGGGNWSQYGYNQHGGDVQAFNRLNGR